MSLLEKQGRTGPYGESALSAHFRDNKSPENDHQNDDKYRVAIQAAHLARRGARLGDACAGKHLGGYNPTAWRCRASPATSMGWPRSRAVSDQPCRHGTAPTQRSVPPSIDKIRRTLISAARARSTSPVAAMKRW